MSIQAILYQKGTNVETIAPDTSVKDAAARLREENIAALVATKGDAILGVISEREIVHALSSHGERAATMNVGDILVFTPGVQVSADWDFAAVTTGNQLPISCTLKPVVMASGGGSLVVEQRLDHPQVRLIVGERLATGNRAQEHPQLHLPH